METVPFQSLLQAQHLPAPAPFKAASLPRSEQDWDAQRMAIRRLYLDEDMTLKEVMAIMERDHHFKAT